MKKCIVALITFLVMYSVNAGKFQKIAWWDPYGAMLYGAHGYGGDTTGLSPEQYIAQIDSFGITLSKGYPDSLATHYASDHDLGVKFWGQDRDLKIKGVPFYDLIFRGFVGHGEVERNDVTRYGYWWNYSQGSSYPPVGDPVGRYYRPGADAADTVLELYGPTFMLKYPAYMYPYFVMKVWDTLTTDTICDVIMYYWVPINDTLRQFSKVYSYRGVDFQNPDSSGWSIFKPSNTLSYTDQWKSNSFKIYWRGNDSLAIDNISLRSANGQTMEQAAFENLTNDSIEIAIANYYDRIDTSSHAKFFPEDEPRVSQFWGINLWDDNAVSVLDHRVLSSINHSIPTYLIQIDPPEVLPNYYPIRDFHDSLSEPSGGLSSIQAAYDSLTKYLEIHNGEILPEGREFWIFIQAGGFIDSDTTLIHRDPTTLELVTQANLAVAYGATGIGYFVYTSTKSDPVNGFCFPGSEEKFETFPLSQDKALEPWTYHGLSDWNYTTQRCEPNARWYAGRDWNRLIDSLWITLDSLTWQDADGWLEVASISGSIIDTIYSTTFAADKTYLEVGRFTSPGGDEYYSFVNRRSLSSDSQDVVIQLDNRPGVTRFYDVYEQRSYDVFDSSGVVKFTTHFAPGQLKLFRIDDNVTQLSGSWSGEWTKFATVNLVGDITVDSGYVLEIKTDTVPIAAYNDTLASGSDPDKIEIICNWGELRIEGSPASRVIFTPSSANDSSWYGIRTIGGKLVMDNAVIKGAYAGLKLQDEKYDTVMNSRFENCFMYGVYNESNNAYFTCDTFLNSPNGYGIKMYYADSGTFIEDAYFQDVKYPVDLYASSPVIEHSTFYATAFFAPGQPAIKADWYSDAKINYCEFNNTFAGIRIHQRSDVEVFVCVFDSDSLYKTINDTIPFMSEAIQGTGGLSTCKVRSCCFNAADDAYIYKFLTAFDLGSPSSFGNSSFHAFDYERTCQHTETPPCYTFKPHVAVDNESFGTQQAVGNYWQLEDSSWWFYGSVNIDSALSTPVAACEESGGQSKLVETAAANTEALPHVFSLSQNYPNPFNPVTTIAFSIPEREEVVLEIYNILGQKVNELHKGVLEAGEYTLDWDGCDKSGTPVSSGVYFYKITAGENLASRKMILLK